MRGRAAPLAINTHRRLTGYPSAKLAESAPGELGLYRVVNYFQKGVFELEVLLCRHGAHTSEADAVVSLTFAGDHAEIKQRWPVGTLGVLSVTDSSRADFVRAGNFEVLESLVEQDVPSSSSVARTHAEEDSP